MYASSNHSSTGIGTSIGIYSRRRRRRLCLCLFICRRRINFVIKRCEVGMKYRSFRKSLNPKKEKEGQKKYSMPGSNRRPRPCEGRVITTRLIKLCAVLRRN